MSRNIEIKARVSDFIALAAKATALADRECVVIAQDDTFFHCEAGRLKLRAFSSTDGELIFYRRADAAGPKESFYVRSATVDPDSLRHALTLAYGQSGRVRKTRWLYFVGRTRVHLDQVEGLGHFVELEVMLADDEPAEAGVAVANELMARLGIEASQLVAKAYVDLLAVAQEAVSRGY